MVIDTVVRECPACRKKEPHRVLSYEGYGKWMARCRCENLFRVVLSVHEISKLPAELRGERLEADTKAVLPGASEKRQQGIYRRLLIEALSIIDPNVQPHKRGNPTAWMRAARHVLRI